MFQKNLSMNLKNEEKELFHRQFVLFSDLTVITTALLFFIHTLTNTFDLALLLGSVIFIGVVNQWLYYYYKTPYVWAVNFFIAIHTLVILIASYNTGGLTSIYMGWFLFPPIVSIMLLRERMYMYIWLFIVLLILVIYAYLYWLGFILPNVIAEDNLFLLRTVSYIFVFSLLFSFSFYFLERETYTRNQLEYIQSLLTTSNTFSYTGTWEYNRRYHTTYFNDVSRDILKLPKHYDNKVGLSAYFSAAPNHLDEIDNFLHKLDDSPTVLDKEFSIVVSTGQLKWIRIIGIYNKNTDNTVPVYGIIQDITKQKEMEAEWLKSKQISELNDAIKKSFVSRVSRDLRSPLNIIIGFSDLLDTNQMTEEQILYLKALQTSSNTLYELITEVLDLQAENSLKRLSDPRPTAIEKMVVETVSLFKLEADRLSIDLKVVLDPDLPNLLLVDPIRLKQVLINLISNAIKFTEKGSVEVYVMYLPREGKNGELKVEVKDTGIGISEENIKTIFNAFEQGQQLKVRPSLGTGLGLTITNQLLHSMQSVLEVKSQIGKGSVFYFHLPVSAVEITVSTDIKLYQEEDISVLDGTSFKIVLAEDQEMNLQLLQSMIRRKYPNASIFITKNGEDSLQSCLINQPQILITDVHMPVMNGFDMIKKYRELSPNHDTRIIVLTAGVSGHEEELCHQLGVDYFFAKPVLPEQLYTALYSIKNRFSK